MLSWSPWLLASSFSCYEVRHWKPVRFDAEMLVPWYIRTLNGNKWGFDGHSDEIKNFSWAALLHGTSFSENRKTCELCSKMHISCDIDNLNKNCSWRGSHRDQIKESCHRCLDFGEHPSHRTEKTCELCSKYAYFLWYRHPKWKLVIAWQLS